MLWLNLDRNAKTTFPDFLVLVLFVDSDKVFVLVNSDPVFVGAGFDEKGFEIEERKAIIRVLFSGHFMIIQLKLAYSFLFKTKARTKIDVFIIVIIHEPLNGSAF